MKPAMVAADHRPRIGARLAARAAAVALILAAAACGALPGSAQPTSPGPSHGPVVSSSPGRTEPTPADDPPTSDPSSSPVGDASCAADIVARICAEVRITGATTVSGRGIVTAPEPPGSDPSTTCAAIAAADGGGDLGDHLDSVDGHQLAWDTSVTDFHGPGTYRGAEFHLTIDDNAYSASDGGTVGISIDPTFATTITLSDLVSSGDSPTKVSGTISWTCVDPTPATE